MRAGCEEGVKPIARETGTLRDSCVSARVIEDAIRAIRARKRVTGIRFAPEAQVTLRALNRAGFFRLEEG
jgi:hypothetical protein